MIAALAERAGPGPELGPDEVRMLVSVGFHGVLNGQPRTALRLFEALAELRPDEAFPAIGRALALVAEGRAEDAARILEQRALAAPMNDDSIQVFLGLALRQARREHHARAVLSAVAEGEGDPQVRRLARQLLDHPS